MNEFYHYDRAAMSITIRTLEEKDVEAADKVRRLAFGTYFGVPEPLSFSGTVRLVEVRRRLWPDGALVAEENDAIVGVAISSRWGRLGLFGPLAVHPQRWRSGVARRLLEASMPIFDRWDCRAAALFTFPQSIAHIGLYQSFGFWPRSLTAIMSRPVSASSPVPETISLTALGDAREGAIAQCRALTEALFSGLDLGDEIAAVIAHPTSDVIMLSAGSQLTGFAIVQIGPRTETDTGMAYAKFAAVRPGLSAAQDFHRLLDAVNDFAHRSGTTTLTAGVNAGCMEAYRLMIAGGFRTTLQGIAMHRPWIEIYDRPEVFALMDWR